MMKLSTKTRYHRKPESDSPDANASKQRRCLMCGTDFESAWAGERICGRCRSKSVWRESHGWTSGTTV